MTAILSPARRPRSAGRTRSGSSPSPGTFAGVRRAARSAATRTSSNNFNALNAAVRRRDDHAVIAAANAPGVQPGRRRTWTPPCRPSSSIMTFMMWNWWSVYLSGELKSASNRAPPAERSCSARWSGTSCSSPSARSCSSRSPATTSWSRSTRPATPPTPSPPAPWYHFLASLVNNIPVLTFLIVGSFLFWSLPAMVGNTFMPIRSRLRLVVRPAPAREASPT